MPLRLMSFLVITSLLFGGQALAQNDGQPTIAFLQYRAGTSSSLAHQAFLDVMQAYGFINEAERASMDVREDFDGEKINIFWGDAGGEITTANVLVENAIDRGATLLATLSTPVTQIAVGVTNDMEEPIPVVFSVVGAPYTAGIAESPCIKPAHVAGTRAHAPRHLSVPLALLQNPEAASIGMLVNAADAVSVKTSNVIRAAAEANGLTFETVAIAAAADLPIGAGSLVDKGVDAIFISGYVDSVGLPAVVAPALEVGVPVFGLSPGSTRLGAPIGAGFSLYYREGMIQGRIIANYLNGDVDLSTLAVNEIPDMTVALNLDIAADYDFEFSDALLERADYVIQDGASTENTTEPRLPDVSYEELRAADLEFLAGLECSPEMIAEQQAELDAAD